MSTLRFCWSFLKDLSALFSQHAAEEESVQPALEEKKKSLNEVNALHEEDGNVALTATLEPFAFFHL